MNLEEIVRAEEMSMQSVPFPQVVARLAAAGVETYYTDLVRLEKTFYGADGKTHTNPVPLGDAGTIASQFSESDLRSALSSIQRGQMEYPEFLRRIMEAGTMAYVVFIAGRRVLYFGRDGRSHLELFPGATQ